MKKRCTQISCKVIWGVCTGVIILILGNLLVASLTASGKCEIKMAQFISMGICGIAALFGTILGIRNTQNKTLLYALLIWGAISMCLILCSTLYLNKLSTDCIKNIIAMLVGSAIGITICTKQMPARKTRKRGYR